MSARHRLPNRRAHVGFSFVHTDGLTYRCTASRHADGRLGEIFLSASKAGSQLAEQSDTVGILASLLLQTGMAADVIRRSVAGTALAKAIELAEAP